MGRATPSDFTAVLNDFGRYMVKRIDGEYVSESDLYGNKWQRLSSAYLARKIRKGLNPHILQATGDMRASTRYVVVSQQLQIHIDDPKVEFHQNSETKRRLVLPDQRRGLPQQDVVKLKQLTRDRLIRAFSFRAYTLK
jgi:hypothetical protein